MLIFYFSYRKDDLAAISVSTPMLFHCIKDRAQLNKNSDLKY